MRRTDREVTNFNELEDMIKQCKTCHVAMVDDGRPYIVPLNFGYKFFGESLFLYFHSAKEGKKIDILRQNNSVCFEMTCEGSFIDSAIPCNCGYCFSSIIGFGTILFIDDPEEKSQALSTMFKHQTNKDITFNHKQAASVCVYKLVSTEFTGKKKCMPNHIN